MIENITSQFKNFNNDFKILLKNIFKVLRLKFNDYISKA